MNLYLDLELFLQAPRRRQAWQWDPRKPMCLNRGSRYDLKLPMSQSLALWISSFGPDNRLLLYKIHAVLAIKLFLQMIQFCICLEVDKWFSFQTFVRSLCACVHTHILLNPTYDIKEIPICVSGRCATQWIIYIKCLLRFIPHYVLKNMSVVLTY